jgi:hypothetical protein
MAHYLSEKIESSERLTGAKREDAARQIAGLIVQLWATRRTAPIEKEPLPQVDAVSRALARLDPERRAWGFYDRFAEGDEPTTTELESNQALQVALRVDRIAGDLVRSLVAHAAVLAAADEAEWLLPRCPFANGHCARAPANRRDPTHPPQGCAPSPRPRRTSRPFQQRGCHSRPDAPVHASAWVAA